MTTLAVNIHDSIIKLFERIENQHGRILVSHAFGYVTLSKGGVTETELEDLISLDEKVIYSTVVRGDKCRQIASIHSMSDHMLKYA